MSSTEIDSDPPASTGQVAFVTGANKGIGRAISLLLATKGYRLFLLARDESALSEVARECQALGSSVDYLAGELADAAYMDAAIAKALAICGSIDVLINNAGTADQAAVQNANLAIWQGVMDVNFNAVVYLSNQILPGMIDRGVGTIVNISSISGRNTSAGSAIYSASKHALNGFSGCMFEDVREHGIKVSTIMPGFVETQLTGGLGLRNNRLIQAQDVAESVAYVLSASPTCCPTEIVLRPQRQP